MILIYLEEMNKELTIAVNESFEEFSNSNNISNFVFIKAYEMLKVNLLTVNEK
jgi:hypothetical protein